MAIELYDYQEEMVRDVRLNYLAGKNAVLCVCPTGGGKTFTFAYITQKMAEKGKICLILVHRKELLEQASLSLAALGVEHNLIASAEDVRATKIAHMNEIGICRVNHISHVHVASVQTLQRRLKSIRWTPDLIVVDEAHHATAGQWRTILNHFNQSRILGVTATPIRTDGTGLDEVFDTLIESVQMSELIERGRLTPYRAFAPAIRFNSVAKIKVKGGEFDQKDLSQELQSNEVYGDVIAHYRRYSDKLPAVGFCPTVADAHRFAAAFNEAGYNSAAIDGAMLGSERRKILKGLANGSIDVVMSCDTISEGTDIPVVTTAILLRKTLSLGLYLQQVGRVLRTAPGKTNAIILDHVGNTLRHGLPDQNRIWTLNGRKKGRGTGEQQEQRVNVVTCSRCFAIYSPASSCPVCGNIEAQKEQKEIQQIDGELRELTAAAQKELIEAKKMEDRQEIAQANTLEELQEIAKKRGYHPNWARHIFKNSRKQRSYSASHTPFEIEGLS